jgi:hypothetical protein
VSVKFLRKKCFAELTSLRSLTFESNSKLTQFDQGALYACSLLKSICIPLRVRVIGESSFCLCESLSSLTFEPSSKLNQIESNAFCGCSSLPSVCLPASVKFHKHLE